MKRYQSCTCTMLFKPLLVFAAMKAFESGATKERVSKRKNLEFVTERIVVVKGG
ncbi:MAG: hypothetical protein MN733_00585 [Nitrososphaera sp.]|nr:hypothetical protein [Nitrososphaera sp.]